MCTAVLPLYLSTLGLGPAALGLIEGVADFLVSLSKLAGGVVGHQVQRKRPWTALGYLTTTVATGAIALVGGLAALVSLRSLAWIGRGFRGPLRDYMLADAVESSHFGRAYGLERAGDMASSLYVGYFLETGHATWAFGLAAACGAVGVLWLTLIRKQFQSRLLV